MRLTLRTLLAYLDDTLPASEAKAMGEKLAESEPAQEIVERIKNVIRRRRLTVPPASSRIDANTLAEYLDNEITPDLAEELERICLSSDVHLAEVSACHQILSLVLGEPPAAPELAVKRMYGIGKAEGETGVTAKKPTRPAGAADKPAARQREADEALRMGLPSVFVKDWANRGMVFAFGAIACLLIVVAAMQLLKKPEPELTVDLGTGTKLDYDAKDKSNKVGSTKKEDETPPEVIQVAPKPDPVVDKKADAKVNVIPVVPPPPPPPKTDIVAPDVPAGDLPPPVFGSVIDKKTEDWLASLGYEPPSTKVAAVGQVFEPAKGQVSVVLQQSPKSNEWKRLSGKSADVYTTRPLVSVPGSKATITTLKGVRITAWGNFPEMTQYQGPSLYESMVEFHDHETLDLDMTVRRGRVLIANLRDDPIVVRVRFGINSDPKGPDTFWLLRLSGANTGGAAEAMVDRWSTIPAGEPFVANRDDPERKDPVTNMACLALLGTIFLKTPSESVTLRPADVNMAVSLGSDKKMIIDRVPPIPWLDAKFVPTPEVAKVRNEINSAFAGKAVDVAMLELMRSSDMLTRRTAVRLLGAIDDLPGLLDTLVQEKIEQRDAAVETLRNWISLSPDNDYKLYDLVRPRLKGNEAEMFMSLLHGFSPKALSRPETYELMIEYLRHRQMEIRELAAWNLYRIVPAGQSITYDAADPLKRERAYQQWLKLIPPGKLPQAPKTKAGAEPRLPQIRAAIWVEHWPSLSLEQAVSQPRNHFIRSQPLLNSRLDAEATASS